MAIRSTLLPAATLAIPFLLNACGNDPISAFTTPRALEASSVAADPTLKLDPTAGNFTLPDYKPTGNAGYSQAQWTKNVVLDGKFSVLLQKTVDFQSCYTPPIENGCAAFAAVIVTGVEGMTIADLGAIGFSVSGSLCGAGSPRFNLYYSNGGGQADGVAFYGCAAHMSGTPLAGWTSMSVSSTSLATPASCYSFTGSGACTLTSASTVVQLSVIVDEQGTWYIDRVQVANATTGEPNGSN